jgi:iron-sulfur cluster repair protein YtfE (RIC family)
VSPTRPSHALALLAEQHRQLREMMAECEALADALDAGRGDPSQLLGAVAALRKTFDDHNELEEELLPPVMIDTDWLGAVRVSRMVEDHIEEHGALARELAASTSTAASAELRSVLASLRDHLDTEERYFLSPKVLRDDLVG